MYDENPLDNAIHRFQHRWETDRQYRSMMSGVLGLVLIVFLCSCVGLLDMGATRALAAVGIGGTTADQSGGASQPNVETGVQVGDNEVFYTPTVPTWAVPVIPQAQPNPSSAANAPTPTPSPTPTDVPTRPACTSNCGGGGSIAGDIAVSWAPSTWSTGIQGSFTVHAYTDTSHTVSEPGVGLAIVYTWSSCTNCNWLDENGESTDSTGTYISHPTTGTCTSSHTYAVWVQAHFPGGAKDYNYSIPCS